MKKNMLKLSILAVALGIAGAGQAADAPVWHIPASSAGGQTTAAVMITQPANVCTSTNGKCYSLTAPPPAAGAPSGTMCGSHRDGGPQWVADIPCMGQSLTRVVEVMTLQPIYTTVCTTYGHGHGPDTVDCVQKPTGSQWVSVPTAVQNCPAGYTYTSYVNDNGATAVSAGIYYTCVKN